MNIVFLGPPGSGKGTHAQKVSDAMGIPRISTGDMLRENMKLETPLGLEAKAFVESGKLVPDELVIDMLKERIAERDCAKGVIFDGFPRTARQAEELDQITTIDRVVNLNIDDAAIVRRMAGRRVCPACGFTTHVDWMGQTETLACKRCGGVLEMRADDAPETVRERLRVYHEQTQPLIDYYSKKGLLHTVDTDAEVEEVEQRVRKALA